LKDEEKFKLIGEMVVVKKKKKAGVCREFDPREEKTGTKLLVCLNGTDGEYS
jgi:hypothetical protein